MSQKSNQLHQLLLEDQEPFHLRNYIDDRRHQLLLWRPSNNLRLTKPKPSSGSIFKNRCFLSGYDSPDITKPSSLVDFPKSPRNRKINPIPVPEKIAETLFQASSRILKQSASKHSNSKTKGGGRSTLFRSILKKLKHKDEKNKNQIRNEVRVSVKDLLRWDSAATALYENPISFRENPTFSPGIPESGCSCRLENTEIDDFETEFCDSPIQYVHPSSPSGDRTPEFLTPVGSPSRLEIVRENKGGADAALVDSVKVRGNEEEKEHCSPVTVLDHDPSAEEEEDVEERHEDDDESSSFDMERSYANVKRTQQKLLEKLSRFEKLAKLDPIEFEKSILEDERDLSDDFDFTDEEWEESSIKVTASLSKSALSYIDKLNIEALNQPKFRSPDGVTADLKKVTKMLFTEELNVLSDKDILLERVTRRLNPWKIFAGGMINAMLGLDVEEDLEGWTRKQEQIAEVAMDIELHIFEALVDESVTNWLRSS